MFIRILCLLVLAAVAYGHPYGKYDNGNIDPGFSRYPNQGGYVPDAGFGNGHGQGGHGGFVPDAGFGNGHGQGGLPSQDASGFQGGHKYGYQQYGY